MGKVQSRAWQSRWLVCEDRRSFLAGKCSFLGRFRGGVPRYLVEECLGAGKQAVEGCLKLAWWAVECAPRAPQGLPASGVKWYEFVVWSVSLGPSSITNFMVCDLDATNHKKSHSLPCRCKVIRRTRSVMCLKWPCKPLSIFRCICLIIKRCLITSSIHRLTFDLQDKVLLRPSVDAERR